MNSTGHVQLFAGRGLLYVHHTDATREWAYDRDLHIGKLDKGLDEAKKRGWTVVDMKKDWKAIYSFQKIAGSDQT